MFTFTVPQGMKFGKACSSDSSRYAINNAMILPVKDAFHPDALLVATDGRIAACLPVEYEGELTGNTYLPADALNANGKPAKVSVNGELRTEIGKKVTVHPPVTQEGRFPPVKSALPVPALVCGDGDHRPYRQLTIDANLLKKLADAISADGKVTLFIPQDDATGDPQTNAIGSAIAVLGHSDDGPAGYGAIMPFDAFGNGRANEQSAQYAQRYQTAYEKMPSNYGA